MSTLAIRRLRFVLFASLALNVFLIGLQAGAWLDRDGGFGRFGGPPHHRVTAGLRHFALPRMTEGLPEAARDQARQIMADRRDAVHAPLRRVREARRALGEALAAEPFSQDRAAAAAIAMQDSTAASQAAVHAVMIEIARTLPPEARRQFAEPVRRERGWKRFRRRPE